MSVISQYEILILKMDQLVRKSRSLENSQELENLKKLISLAQEEISYLLENFPSLNKYPETPERAA